MNWLKDHRLKDQGRTQKARSGWRALAIIIILGVVYFGSPYFTLYRLGTAVRSADAATLQSLVDWSAVREGLKEDICDMVLDEPSAPSNQLAPFGSGFVRGITGNLVDKAVTPELVVSLTRSTPSSRGADTRVRWAFFNDPTHFSINIVAEGSAEPIRVEMEFRHMRWQVRRVWLPNELLERANSKT